ncbi:hypothetical protein [Propionivibrio limicola]|uniref:hypothetical protein n=1 Tax=Propionivibrio limicola TaxID=167645 RepID=UPI00129161BB|nr:hypothetical protein [Propionivibrio limicola]
MSTKNVAGQMCIGSLNAVAVPEKSFFAALVEDLCETPESLKKQCPSPEAYQNLLGKIAEHGIVTFKKDGMDDDTFGVIARLPSGKLATCLVKNEWVCETNEAANAIAEKLSHETDEAKTLVFGTDFLQSMDS